MLNRFSVAIPMARLDVLADRFEQVGLFEIAQLNSVGFVFNGDGATVDVNGAVLSVEAFGRKFVHRVVCCVFGESCCLSRLTNRLHHPGPLIALM